MQIILIYSFLLLFFVDFIFTVDKTYYDILEVTQGATNEAIKREYRKACSNTANKNTKEFLKIKEAYTILINPEKREEYDMELKSKGLLIRRAKNRATEPQYINAEGSTQNRNFFKVTQSIAGPSNNSSGIAQLPKYFGQLKPELPNLSNSYIYGNGNYYINGNKVSMEEYTSEWKKANGF
ncbi:hypothetical protein Mgra_00001436 [Meloidogyne graminicola]|uniref:DnaJ homolog subfamily B member 9 n=1 Tax=Meloidogyne graminicola TaxID=189291 RepID=A0A8T0A1D2_9BILA|nr:hypothetical protein Mgra_00001436 [Meloidogyne graminicola]